MKGGQNCDEDEEKILTFHFLYFIFIKCDFKVGGIYGK